ncbi:hypothetical protein I4U23_007043 [Adineta vaga]|nr:hypothetical protein I4U23_007043 [Adineta vaga]
MACEHPGCSLTIFSTCTNHCKKNVCLEHLIEHGDTFILDFTNLIDQVDKAAVCLTKAANNTTTSIVEQRQCEITRINRMYDEEQQVLRKRLAFAEATNAFVKEKQDILTNSKPPNECHITQHDLEQIRIYTIQIKNATDVKQEKSFTPRQLDIHDSRMYQCPLTRSNVFGITLEHKIRFDCDGSYHLKYSILKHFEYYHRMLPDCALRLRNAIVDDKLSPETKLFSDTDILLNQDYRVDCPLTDPTNIYGSSTELSSLKNIPCTKKQLTLPSMVNHFHLYHKMRYDVSKKIYKAIQTKSLHADLVLFGKNQRLGIYSQKK